MKEKAAKPRRNEKTEEEIFQGFWFIWNLIEDLLLIVAGALAITLGLIAGDDSGLISGDNKVIINIILYSIAAFVVLDGILRTVLLAKNYKKSESSAYLIGGFEMTVGIVLMIMGAEVFFKLIINFLGVFLIVMGALLLFVAITAIVKKIESQFMPILEILFGAILVGFGIALMIIYHAGEAQLRNRVSFVLIGIIIALTGIAMLIGLIIGRRKQKKNAEKIVRDNNDRLEKKSPEVEVEIISPAEVKEEPKEEKKPRKLGKKSREIDESGIKAIEDKSNQE